MSYLQRTIADTISEELELPVRIGRQFLRRALELIADELVKVGRAELRGLGTFTVYHQGPHKTKAIGTGKPITIPARKVLRYRSSVVLRRRLNPAPKKTRKR